MEKENYKEEKGIFSKYMVYYPLMWFAIFGLLSFNDWCNYFLGNKIYKDKFTLEVGSTFYFGLLFLFGIYLYMIIKPFKDKYLKLLNHLRVYTKYNYLMFWIVVNLQILYFRVHDKYFYHPVSSVLSSSSSNLLDGITVLMNFIVLFVGFTTFNLIYYDYIVEIKGVELIIKDSNNTVIKKSLKRYIFKSGFLLLGLMILCLHIYFSLNVSILLESILGEYLYTAIITTCVLFFILRKKLEELSEVIRDERRYENLLERLKEYEEFLKSVSR